MVKGKGVCVGYAGAFKLLADKAGLQSIVITGGLNNLNHAWNKVYINGDWVHVDVTNNYKNMGVPYYLYEGNDEFANKLGYLVGTDYWTDAEINQLKFNSVKENNDYYVQGNLEVDGLEHFSSLLEDIMMVTKPSVISLRFKDGTMPSGSDIKNVIIDKVVKTKEKYKYFAIKGNYVIVKK